MAPQHVNAGHCVPKREGSHGPQAKYAPGDNAMSPMGQTRFSNVHDDAPDVSLHVHWSSHEKLAHKNRQRFRIIIPVNRLISYTDAGKE